MPITMTTMNEAADAMLKVSSPEALTDEQNAEQPTAFISKLFQMIEGAPDEVIAVSKHHMRIGS